MIQFARGDPSRNNRVTYVSAPLWILPIWSVIEYFWKFGSWNFENLYFLVLSLIQVSTHPLIGILPADWSPTGALSTFIPLLLCIILKVVGDIMTWLRLKQNENIENYRQITCMEICTEGYFSYLKPVVHVAQNLQPGMIIHLIKDQLAPVDGVLVSNLENLDQIPDGHCLISLSPLNGEVELIPVEPIQRQMSVTGMTNLTLESTRSFSKTLTRFEGLWTQHEHIYELDDRHFVPAGAIVKSDHMYLWVIATGTQRRSHTTIDESRLNKDNTLDRLISAYLLGRIIYMLMAQVLWVTVWTLTQMSTPLTFGYVILRMVQAWMIFNGIIPFSVKIYLTVTRQIQSYIMIDPSIAVSQAHLLEEICLC